MKNYLSILILVAGLAGFTRAQQPLKNAIQNISYTFQSNDGTNACAVVWMPSMGQYATVIAGNAEFPVEFFDSKGETKGSYLANLDIRGMWWDSKKEMLMANGAGELGWYKIDPRGLAENGEWQLIRDGQIQPDFQSVLTSNGKLVFAYYSEYLYHFKLNGKAKGEYVVDYDGTIADLNGTTVAYTGVDAYPLALLNAANFTVEYFDLGGKFLASTALPIDGIDVSMFRFSFANRMAWLYDVDTRTWTAFKCFP